MLKSLTVIALTGVLALPAFADNTTSPGTTSPGTTSPSTSSPGTPSPGTTVPGSSREMGTKPNPGAAGPSRSFRDLDSDRNGTISESEMRGSGTTSSFTTLDKNGDGRVSQDEFDKSPTRTPR